MSWGYVILHRLCPAPFPPVSHLGGTGKPARNGKKTESQKSILLWKSKQESFKDGVMNYVKYYVDVKVHE